jgi:hypothetical protein
MKTIDMETSLVENREVFALDEVLGTAIGFINAPPLSGQSLLRLGIENESGEIYRIIGVKDLLTLMHLIKRFSDLRCTVETLQGKNRSDLRAVVKCDFPRSA